MVLYTFYPERPDGSSVAFQALELNDDGAARAKAGDLLAEHGSCVAVTIWREDRSVATIRAIPAGGR